MSQKKGKQRVTLLHLTWDHPDIEWTFTTGGGPGGQNQNKVATKVRVKHKPSGAVAQDNTTRHQRQNRVNAWKKMASSKEFQTWARREAARLSGKLDGIEEAVEAEMKKIKVERKENGKWVEWEDDGLVGSRGTEESAE